MAPAAAVSGAYAGREMDGRLHGPAFIGRHEGLDTARRALLGVTGGQASHLLVAGEAGIGKTRFAGAVAELAAGAGFQVLWGNGIDLGEGEQVPYAAIADLLRDLASSTDSATLREVIAGHEDALGRITRRLGRAGDKPRLPLRRATDRAQVVDALRIVVERLAARTPVLMVVDDVHWADDATLEALRVLARSPRVWRLGLVMTFRSDETDVHGRLRDWLGDVERLDGLVRVDLGPLSVEETRDLLAAVRGESPDDALVAAVHARSDGNPLFIEALAGSDAASGSTVPISPGLRDILLARVAAVPDGDVPVLRLAAVAGRDVDAGVLAAAAAMSGEAFDAALRESVARGLVVVRRTPTGDRVACRHALVGEVIEGELLPGERRRLHRALAGALADAAGDSGTAEPGLWAELAFHWDRAGDERQTLAATVHAAAEAEHKFAFGQALAHYRRALASWERVADPVGAAGVERMVLLDRAASAAWLAGGPGAVELLGEAVREADRSRDDVERALQRTRLGRALWVTGHPIASSRVYAEAEALLPTGPASDAGARVEAGLANLAMLEGRHRRAIATAERAIADAQAVDALDVEGDALNTLACSAANLGLGAIARAAYERSLAIAIDRGDPDEIGRIEHNATEILSLIGDDEHALELALAGAARMDAMGMGVTYGAFVRIHAAVVAHELGRWQEARELVAGFDLRGLDPLSEVYVLARTVGQSVDRGAWDVADRQLARIGGLLGMFLTEDQCRGPFSVAQAELALWRGDAPGALAVIEEGLERLGRTDDIRWRARLRDLGMRAAADAAGIARLHHDAAAEASAEARADAITARTADVVDGVRAMDGGLAAELAAELATADAERARLLGSSADDAWRLAADAWRHRRRPYREAYALYRVAEAELAADRRGAPEALRSARRAAVGLGAQPLLDAIDGLARRFRVGPGPVSAADAAWPPGSGHPSADAFGLTPREAAVLELVARGMTNRQVAAALGISVNTVGVHVSRVLDKLGVGTRTEAAGVAYRLDLAGPAGHDRESR